MKSFTVLQVFAILLLLTTFTIAQEWSGPRFDARLGAK